MAEAPPSIDQVLGPDGLLAQSLQGFEYRPGQVQMAHLIDGALRKGGPALVEAGTGTGKTFGYLLPLILSGKKGVISTGTKNLQEQIFFKDLPLLQKTAGLKTEAMIMKGRKNYLCLHRYHEVFSQPSLVKEALSTSREKLKAWLERTEFADRSEIPWLADNDALWDALSSSSEQCLGGDCLFLDQCFLGKLRRRAAECKIIIVNHHLFFADLKVKKGGFGEIIPRFQVVVFDEAHDIEEIATAYLGESLGTGRLHEYIKDLEKAVKLDPDLEETNVKASLEAVSGGVQKLAGFFEGREEKGRLEEEDLSSLIQGPARDISRGLKQAARTARLRASDNLTFPGLAARAEDMDRLLEETLMKRDATWLNWYERRRRSLVLHASPLDISERMKALLYGKVQTVVFTSATISTNGSFDYIRGRLGVQGDALEGIYPSHFDFVNQALLYLPKDLPLPHEPNFALQAAERTRELLEITQGRALVLFTSYHNLNLAYQLLEQKLPYTLYRQGDQPRHILLEAFRNDVPSVLMGTASFWQGVDVPGESLSCLIIDKLPFDSPAEPLVAARIHALRERGENPFMTYQVPSAVISLRQGLGRLIRRGSDRGLLSVLDIRILRRPYGQVFMESLPTMPLCHDLNRVRRFFGKDSGEDQV